MNQNPALQPTALLFAFALEFVFVRPFELIFSATQRNPLSGFFLSISKICLLACSSPLDHTWQKKSSVTAKPQG